MIARRFTLTALVWVASLVGLLVFSGVPVQAAITHQYLSHITEVPAGSGAPFPGPFLKTGIGGLTVDSGELYLADGVSLLEGTSRLDRFDIPSGAFVSQFPQVPSPNLLNQGVAVGHATGEAEVYIA